MTQRKYLTDLLLYLGLTVFLYRVVLGMLIVYLETVNYDYYFTRDITFRIFFGLYCLFALIRTVIHFKHLSIFEDICVRFRINEYLLNRCIKEYKLNLFTVKNWSRIEFVEWLIRMNIYDVPVEHDMISYFQNSPASNIEPPKS